MRVIRSILIGLLSCIGCKGAEQLVAASKLAAYRRTTPSEQFYLKPTKRRSLPSPQRTVNQQVDEQIKLVAQDAHEKAVIVLYVLQVYRGDDRAKALRYHHRLEKQGNNSVVLHDTKGYQVVVGAFLHQLTAWQERLKLVRFYPNACLVERSIPISELPDAIQKTLGIESLPEEVFVGVEEEGEYD